MKPGRSGLMVVIVLSLFLTLMAAPAMAGDLPTDRPLTLEECVAIALGTHPKIKAAEQNALAGKSSTDAAISAFWPQVTFETSRDYIHSERQTRVGGVSAKTTASYISNNATFSTEWTLFDFGQTYFGVKSLAAAEESLLKDLTTTQQAVAYGVMDAYFGLLKAQSLVKVTEDSLAASEGHLKQAQAFFDVGVKPKFDVTKAEVEVNGAKVTLITARDAVKSARASLNTKLGADPVTPIVLEERPELEELGKALPDYYKEALKNRPELQSLEAKVASAEMSTRAAVSGYLPTVSFSAARNWYKEDHTGTLPNEDLALKVDVPIFNGFRTNAKVNGARAAALAAKYNLEDQKRAVLLDVSNAYIDVEDARARKESLETSVREAKENLEIAQGRYEAGVGPLIDVTDAQVSLTKAETDRTQAIYDYHTAFTSLLKSVGQGVK